MGLAAPHENILKVAASSRDGAVSFDGDCGGDVGGGGRVGGGWKGVNLRVEMEGKGREGRMGRRQGERRRRRRKGIREERELRAVGIGGRVKGRGKVSGGRVEEPLVERMTDLGGR